MQPHPVPATRRPTVRARAVVLVSVLLALTVTACDTSRRASSPATSSPDTVDTRLGRLHGSVDHDVVRFRGIPYAEPPVGELRWQAPHPVSAWTGVRAAQTPGPQCRQPTGGPDSSGAAQSEDCLYLDVTAPVRPEQNRPVMVWIHGGSLQTGSGSQYDAADLAAHGDVVVVTINYRLSAMGFLALPGMTGPAGAFGLADQQQALRFVQDNAAAFGGDPGNVTVFGESGGGVSTCAQLTAPGARGLFQRAIVQSAVGFCGDPIEPGTVAPGQPEVSNFAPRSTVEQTSLQTAAAVGCPDAATALACLRGKPADTLVAAGKDLILPAYGGPDAVLPTSPAQALEAGDVADVPVLAGFTSDEPSFLLGQAVLAGFPDLTDSTYASLLDQEYGPRAGDILARYPAARYRTPNDAWVAAHADGGWACPAVRLNDTLAQRAAPVYGYEFADRTSPPAFDYPPSVTPGAAHGAEIPYLFGVSDGYGAASTASLTPAQTEVSRQVIEVWTRFARTGDPGTPRWSDDHRSVMFGGSSPTADLWQTHDCGFWNS